MRGFPGFSFHFIGALSLITVGCNDSSTTFPGGGGGGTPSPSPSPTQANNVVPITVGGTGLCGKNVNLPCTSVTVCVPGTSTCQTISDILVDTGSYGLRIFSQAVTLALPAVKVGGNPVAECAQFGTGTDWGPVDFANVQLGNEPFVTIPIQVINSTYATIPTGSGCTTPDTSPTQAGFNGILGVGLFVQDCGLGCTTTATNGIYYSCSGTSCTGTTLPLVDQVSNPVASLPTDNNGVVMSLPAVAQTGTTLVNGQMFLGVGTQSNNIPVGTTTNLANTSGNMTTNFNSQNLTTSFIDSGSNGLFFPAPANLPSCASNDPHAPGWFCPTTTQNYTATNASYTGASSVNVSFQIANASNLIGAGETVLNDLGADSSKSGFSTSFDWGLPFFLGRKVYVGIEGTRCNQLGVTGPYWSY